MGMMCKTLWEGGVYDIYQGIYRVVRGGLGRFGDDSRPRDDERRVSPIPASVSSAESSPTIRGYG